MAVDRPEKSSGGALVNFGPSADSEAIVIPATVSTEATDVGNVVPSGSVVKCT